MGFKKLLVAATGIASIPAFAGQDPEMNQQFAAPSDDLAVTVSGTASESPIQTVRVVERSSKLLTGKFTNAKPQDVLNWLQKNGINFVIESGQLDKDARITLNVEKQPAESVVDAISAALGGHFANRNGILVFQKGNHFFAPMASMRAVPGRAAAPGVLSLPAVPGAPARPVRDRVMPPMPGANQDFKIFTAPGQHEFSFDFGPEFQKKMEGMAKEIELKFGPEFQKKMELHAKEMAKAHGPEHAKKMEEMAKVMELRAKDLEKQIELKIKNGDIAKIDGTRALTINSTNIDGLISSLTSEQKAKLKSKGYLTPSDLNVAQKAKLGKLPEGNFEIRVKKDNEQEFVLKNK